MGGPPPNMFILSMATPALYGISATPLKLASPITGTGRVVGASVPVGVSVGVISGVGVGVEVGVGVGPGAGLIMTNVGVDEGWRVLPGIATTLDPGAGWGPSTDVETGEGTFGAVGLSAGVTAGVGTTV